MNITSRPASGVDEHLARGGAVVYWRPGCSFSMALISELGEELRDVPYWVNIWEDDDGAAQLREHNDGNETVPTVVTADEHFVATDTDRAKTVIGPATPVS